MKSNNGKCFQLQRQSDFKGQGHQYKQVIKRFNFGKLKLAI